METSKHSAYLVEKNLPKEPWHIFIIWNKSLPKKDQIINDVKNKFELKTIFEMNWSQNLFLDNLKRFYGATLPDPEKKLEDCGNGAFFIVLVQDKNPVYRENGTGLQKKLVNGNVFDAKMTYRKWLGVDFAVHGSNTQQETNHDLSLLFGKSLSEITTNFASQTNQTIKISRDLVGANGWSSLKELFHVLNNSTNYVILRNFEDLIEPFQLKNLKDIDILTDDFWQISYIVNKKLRKEGESGPSSYVEVVGKRIKFDFKTPGDGYYDKAWEEDLLKKRRLFQNEFYILDDENYFYSLLYHMLIHKQKLNEKYLERLCIIAKKLKIDNFYDVKDKSTNLKEFLDKFLQKKNYSYTNTRGYRLTHNELTRLTTNAIKISKKQGIGKLFRAAKDKLYRNNLIKSEKI
ncbi:hypothetical protein AAA799P11_00999 [Marine Group I thaumarchaeote SCGC AAA799-P11]|uniref:Uncharacterized protein n=1 Tax=Marine Group I thaumarchaeote SCGC AAA799-P11 TaxID=1502295 RepID=A0A087RZ86_9ARCH|nr:hypothetical protein AAA799P11_00999 [Marine Group I thaumarchaeote SCGC AAA799-P11]